MNRRSDDVTPLPDRLAALQEAVDRATDRLSPDAVAFGQHVVEKATERLRHGTEHTLVALLGATGAGKSSLANALVGSDVATTGVRRPTTSSTMACVWGESDATGLLDWLDVRNRHAVDPGGQGDRDLDGLVVLDVPDHDSVAVEHRLEMERIAEHADLMIWVTDAEKYADAAMHRYLRQLRSHGAVMLVALNKIDALSEGDQRTCVADLIRLLGLDGIEDPRVVVVSALAGTGIDELRSFLGEAVSRQEALVQRLGADVTTAASDLLAETGSEKGGEIGPKLRSQLANDLAGAAGIDAVADAVAAGHRRDASNATGWPFTRWLGKLRPHPLRKLHLESGTGGRSSLPSPTGSQRARAEAAIRDVADQTTEDMAPPWPAVIRKAAMPPSDLLSDQLDQAVAGAVRDHRSRIPRWWAVVGAVQLLLAVATVVGALWLLLLAGFSYLRLPEPPTPEVVSIPIPTGLLLIGALAGWLLAVLSRQFAKRGARRAAKRTRKQGAAAIETVAEELVLTPIEDELANRRNLSDLLVLAGGRVDRAT